MDSIDESLVLSEKNSNSNSNSDSIMFEILNSARDNAQRKALSKEGKELELLNQRSRFFELSIVQFEYAIKRVEEEMESNDSGNDDELLQRELSDLLDRRDDMRARLEESEMIIAQKDREFVRMKENELRFRSAFEEVEKVIKDCEKFDLNDQNCGKKLEKDANDMFGEVRTSIYPHVSKFKTKLENGRTILKVNLGKLKQGSLNGEINFDGLYNITQLLMEFEEMICNLSFIESNIKSSFEAMENSNNLFKRKLEEDQLVMNCEREISTILLKDFIQEIECRNKNFEAMILKESEKLELRNEFLEDHKLIMNYDREISNILLKDFIQETECRKKNFEAKALKESEKLELRNQFLEEQILIMNYEREVQNITLKSFMQEVECRNKNFESTVLNSAQKESENMELRNEFLEEHKLIMDYEREVQNIILKNFIQETEIRSKNYESMALNSVRKLELKNEYLNEQKLNMDYEREVQIIVFESFIQEAECKDKNFESIVLNSLRKLELRNEYLEEQRLIMNNERDVQNIVLENFIKEGQLVNSKRNEIKNSQLINESFDEEQWLINYEREMLKIIFKNSVEQWNKKEEEKYFRNFVKNDLDQFVFSEVLKDQINQCNNYLEDMNLKNSMNGEIDRVVLSETMEDMINDLSSKKDMINKLIADLDVRNSMKEEGEIIKDQINELTRNNENMNFKHFVKKEIDRVVFSGLTEYKKNELKGIKEYMYIKNSLKEEIDCTIFKQIFKDWINELKRNNETMNFKNTVKEEIDFILFSEIIKDRIEDLEMKNSMKGEIDCVVFREIIKDLIRHNNPDNLRHEGAKKKDLEEMCISSYTKLSENFANFETGTNKRIGENNTRLQDKNCEFGIMRKEIISLKKRELLYRNAFLRRCYDLQTAETEVDLLGDEVDLLHGLIKKAYIVLNHHLPDLQNHTEVLEIINVLKQEVEAEKK